MSQQLDPLPYDAAALEPHIDAQTMQIHHGKHHQAYVTNLNAALEKAPELQDRPIEQLLADLNAVPPLGIEGIEVTDNAVEREGVTVFGALGVGGLKMKIHKACIARLFERNDLILDAETIAEVAAELGK